MARKETSRVFNIAVVGLSGTEREKGNTGVGKSCLCNRFVRSTYDDYYAEHISVLSQTDFSGRVVNNDHFLYWGDVIKTTDDGTEYQFHVIEQTEFIDDASFQPFRSGKTEPYLKRCCAVKVFSAEKLMYICKNQLGIEKEYEQKIMPDGRLCIDGFICVFDVSFVQNRSVEKQLEFIVSILTNLLKIKKPVILTTTKNDDRDAILIHEVEKLLSRKEFKTCILLIETSALLNVNIDLAFLVLAQLIDKSRNRLRIVPYFEALKQKSETEDIIRDNFYKLIQSNVVDFSTQWPTFIESFSQHHDFHQYCELYGKNEMQNLFKRYVQKLKEDYVQQKLQAYMDMLPEIFKRIFPDLLPIKDCDWSTILQKLRNQSDFQLYFTEPKHSKKTKLSVIDDIIKCIEMYPHRIPYDVLLYSSAEECFKRYKQDLFIAEKQLEYKKEFKNLLEETGYVTAGKSLSEVKVFFMGQDCFESLTDKECQEIYNLHQKELIHIAKANFRELLMEHMEMFYEISGTITHEDLVLVKQKLKDDIRFKALDLLPKERDLLLLQHLGFVLHPSQLHCPSYPNCMESLIDYLFSQKLNNQVPLSLSSYAANNNQLRLILLGAHGLAQELLSELTHLFENNEIELDDHIFHLKYNVIEDEILQEDLIEFFDASFHGFLCVYCSDTSLNYIHVNLEKLFYSDIENESFPFDNYPIVILLAADPSVEEKDYLRLQTQGQKLSANFHCEFMNVSSLTIHHFDSEQLSNAFNLLMEKIRYKNKQLNLFPLYYRPDIRIILCILCGDPFTLEEIIAPLLNQPYCHVRDKHNLILEILGKDGDQRCIEVIVSSYHGANAFQSSLIHGFILIYSVKRKASLAMLKLMNSLKKYSLHLHFSTFSSNVCNLPLQIIAISDSEGPSSLFKNELSKTLITEGNAIADKLHARFSIYSLIGSDNNASHFVCFFEEVWKKKVEIERAFNIDNSVEDDTLEINNSYFSKSSDYKNETCHLHSNSFNGSCGLEFQYKKLPPEKLSNEIDETLPLYPNDESDETDLTAPSVKENKLVNVENLNGTSVNPERDIHHFMSTESLPTSFITAKENLKIIDSHFYNYSNNSKFLSSSSATHHALVRVKRGGIPSLQLLVHEKPFSYCQRQYFKLHHTFSRENSCPETSSCNQHQKVLERGIQLYSQPTTPPEPAPPDLHSRQFIKSVILSPSYRSPDDIHSGASDSSDHLFQEGWNTSVTYPLDENFQAQQEFVNFHAFTTERRLVPPPIRPKPKGIMTMKNYTAVADAVAKLNLVSQRNGKSKNAPLALPETIDLPHDYAQVKDAIPKCYSQEYSYSVVKDPSCTSYSKSCQREIKEQQYLESSDSDSDWVPTDLSQTFQCIKDVRRFSSNRRMRKKRIAIPVATPKIPPNITSLSSHTNCISSDGSSLSDENESQMSSHLMSSVTFNKSDRPNTYSEKDNSKSFSFQSGTANLCCPDLILRSDKSNSNFINNNSFQESIKEFRCDTVESESHHNNPHRKIKQKAKNDKLKKREDDKKKKVAEKEKERQDKDRKKRQKMKNTPNTNQQLALEDFAQSNINPVPLILEKCVQFIESEGLDSEGIYRVPGNRSHVDLLFSKFEDDPDTSLIDLDIPVNAVATALKDFCKRIPPLIPEECMEELTNLSEIGDRSYRLFALRDLLKKLPHSNFVILKFLFQHFVRITENYKQNSMDSKNLSICWWPTLLPLQFTAMAEFETMRPHLEDVVQIMIDQYPFLFCGKEEKVMV